MNRCLWKWVIDYLRWYLSILLTSNFPVSASTRKLAAGSSLQHTNAKSSLDCTRGTTFTIRRTFWNIPYQKVIRLSLKSVRTTTHSVLFDHTPWSFQHALTWVDSWPPPQTQPKTATPPTTAIKSANDADTSSKIEKTIPLS